MPHLTSLVRRQGSKFSGLHNVVEHQTGGVQVSRERGTHRHCEAGALHGEAWRASQGHRTRARG